MGSKYLDSIPSERNQESYIRHRVNNDEIYHPGLTNYTRNQQHLQSVDITTSRENLNETFGKKASYGMTRMS